MSDWNERLVAASGGNYGMPTHGSRLAGALLDLWKIAKQAPQHVRVLFPGVDERDLGFSPSQPRSILSGDLRFALDTSSELAALISVVRQARAIDDVLHTIGSLGVGGGTSRFLVKTTLAEGLVLPLRRQRQGRAATLEKRCFKHHRILPACVGDSGEYPIEIIEHPFPVGQLAGARFGACLFLDQQFDLAHHDSGFLVRAVSSRDMRNTILAQLSTAHSSDCLAMAFPELSIDLEHRALIKELLQTKPWRDQPDSSNGNVSLVASGSWHVQDNDGRWFNELLVHDGTGEELLRYRKILPYLDLEDGPEAISSGAIVPLLSFEDALVAVGICKDFAERPHNPLVELDVDLCLVISCGNRSTMAGHLQTANDLRAQTGATSFVVQQAYPLGTPDCPSGIGWVVQPNRDIRGLSPDDIVESAAFST